MILLPASDPYLVAGTILVLIQRYWRNSQF